MNTLPESIHVQLNHALEVAELDFEFRSTSVNKWRDMERQVDYFPVDYSLPVTEFYMAQSLEELPIIDISLILYYNNRPCGLWPLLIAQKNNGDWTMGSNCGPILPPVFLEGFDRKSTKTILSRCLRFVFNFCCRIGQVEFTCIERLINKPSLGDWYNRLLLNGSSVQIYHELYLDLGPPLEKIWSSFRKSYKPLISLGERLWELNLVKSENPSAWDRFMRLHQEVSGKVTRPIETWRSQYKAIVQGDAFLVTIESQDGRMVGGGYFRVTTHEGVYGSGAYDRSMFDKPLGHVVQWHAIMEMKKRGVRWYKLGNRVYPYEGGEISKKEITISNFKQGFASHLVPEFHINCKSYQSESF